MQITRINIGPIHPSTHGVLRLIVDLDGDTIEKVEPHIGFLHRGVEKLVENRMYMQNHVYMEKMDYVAPLAVDELYVATVEEAMGIEVKERAQYIRTIELELQRIASHLFFIGTLCNDIGNLFTVFIWCFADRDRVLRLLETATGSRMFYANMRLGGVKQDFPKGFEEDVLDCMDYIEKRTKEYERFLEKNPIFMERMKNVGILSSEDAIEYGISGPTLRASGIDYDTRKNHPYYAYEKASFSTQVLSRGDSFARYKIRVMEIRESINVIRLAFKKMPEGDATGMPVKLVPPPIKKNEVIVRRELPRGENMMYMVADKKGPYRLAMRSAIFVSMAALDHIARGHKLADLFAIMGSLDFVMADVDK